MVQQAGFGMPTMGAVPAGLLDALYPYLTYLPNLTSQLAQSQFGEQGAIQRAQIAADAARSGDAQRANATVAAAGIGAGAQVESQLIQVKGMLKATQASLIADLEKARNGDIAAGQRYQAGLTQAANLSNQATALELSKMLGSGQLHDNIAARLALRGMGPMPGISSALNGMENRLWATAPTVGTPPMYNAPKIDMGGLGGGGNYGSNIPTFSAGGGGGGGYAPQTSSMGDLYGDLFGKIKSTVGFGDIFKFGASQAPAAVPGAPPIAPKPNVNTMSPEDTKQLIAMGLDPRNLPPDVASWYKASRGGRFGKGQTVLVGEEGPEVLRVGPNAVDVIPLDRTAAKGGTFGYRPAAGEEYIDPNRPQLGVRPKANPVATGGLGPKVTTPTGEEYIDPNRPQLGFKPKANAIPTGGLGPKPASPAAPQPFGYGPATETGGKWTDTRFDQASASNWSSGGGWLDRMKARRDASNQPSKKFGAPPAEAPAAPAAPPVVVIQPTPQAPVVQTAPQLPLSDVNTIPALQQIRSGKVLPPFGIGPTSFSEPGLGITDTPAPYLSASTFQAMAPDEQEDTLQLWEMLGIPRIKALFEMMSSTPGARQYPQKAFGF